MLASNGPHWDDGQTQYHLGELPRYFVYEPDLSAVYNDWAGMQMKAAARIWTLHLTRDFRWKRMPSDQTHRAATSQPAQSENPTRRARGRPRKTAQADQTDDSATSQQAQYEDPVHGFGNPELVEIVQEDYIDETDAEPEKFCDAGDHSDGSDQSEYYPTDHSSDDGLGYD